jgi:hypothetical protein
VSVERCSLCGRSLDSHQRDLRFKLPDPVFAIPEQDRELSWGGDAMVAARGIGQFIRVLLPVRLSGGYDVRYGTWLSVSEEDARRTWEEWDQPSYVDLELSGFLANAIEPWGKGLLGAEAQAKVLKQDELPYIVGSSNELLALVLKTEWPHEDVLDSFPRPA